MTIKHAIIETVFDYEEFTQKLDRAFPVHHNYWSKVSPDNTKPKLLSKFRMYGVSVSGHLLIFERPFETGPNEGERGAERKFGEFVSTYALPLDSTPGRLDMVLIEVARVRV